MTRRPSTIKLSEHDSLVLAEMVSHLQGMTGWPLSTARRFVRTRLTRAMMRQWHWLKNLPPLEPTELVEGREARVHKMPPGPDRWKERSRTVEGVGAAMAAQWGVLA